MAENRIGSERTRMRMTQAELAKLVDVTDKTLSVWEQNNERCPTQKIKKLAGIFGCSTDYLLGMSDERTSN